MKKLFLLIACTFVLNGFPQTIETNDSLNLKIKLLEQKIKLNEAEFRNLRKEVADVHYKVNDAKDKALEAKETSYRVEKKLWSERYGWISGFVAVLAAIGVIFFLKNYIKNAFDKFLIERFKDLKEGDITTLYNEIESAAWKVQIRNKSVLVLNQTNTNLPEDFQTALKVFHPEIKTINEPKDAHEFDFSKYALVVLENYETNGFWDLKSHKDDFIKLTDKICGQNAAFIYYGDSRKGYYPETNVNKHLVNFANSPSQLYNNVMNTLKFQDLLSKHI